MEESQIRYVLTNFKRIATIGFSKDPEKPSHRVPKFLMEHGYVVYPVNPTVTEILGRKSYPSLKDIEDEIEVVQVFRPSKDVPVIIDQVLDRKRERNDVKAIWLQEGIRDDKSAERARAEGLIVIQDKCMYKEYVKLFGE
ncbi:MULTISPECIES: CoA-binding protein [Metallosphaera]|uniref:CoA-binding domain protein n=3 Tax=Metallosphaera TaxID=41980 RepID=A4YH15_METS5|nr:MULTISPECIES: CoA-binding protein [Metallosphaera]ABP95717.1 CoA-binding domain protein [Metallosphaera sedula DSM 5348]AIM27701.1 CoA-binding domain protein [Metallosphaera sedula]AKV74557.1 CoA-binding protein [Metallosphaera sedula]AKV76796.1 CoA-binding protein [Metallosphaera sedula]AKV79047.1 CoA-binding protein [Metallosphaera sedula]